MISDLEKYVYCRNDDLLIIDQGEEENIYSTSRSKVPPQRSSQNGLPRSASLPLNNGTQKRAPPPRPPPPKKNPPHVSIVLGKLAALKLHGVNL